MDKQLRIKPKSQILFMNSDKVFCELNQDLKIIMDMKPTEGIPRPTIALPAAEHSAARNSPHGRAPRHGRCGARAQPEFLPRSSGEVTSRSPEPLCHSPSIDLSQDWAKNKGRSAGPALRPCGFSNVAPRQERLFDFGAHASTAGPKCGPCATSAFEVCGSSAGSLSRTGVQIRVPRHLVRFIGFQL